ncbi:MAG: class I SAM-dependent methyltransferase [Oscillospiraceae bacterium]|nr:class I SAM-dependent methyltransferase [Oscillospiraceae bacterium]
MGDKWANFGTELPYFKELWYKRGTSRGVHTAEVWEERAEEWIDELSDENGGKSMTERVRSMASYLRTRGLLQGGDTVADVGCGPGLFVMEFAKTVKQAVGIDFAERFVKYGNELALNNGISNASFERHDLLEIDVDAAGLSKKFDLVFASITPAVTGKECLHKLMKMSRAMCCNVSFVNVKDSLLERISTDLFDGKAKHRHDGMGFYSLFNFLLLSGYYPETFYCTIETNEKVIPSRRFAEDIAFNLRLNLPEDIEKILKYLEKNGEMERHCLNRYGSILWDTRICDGHAQF